MVFVNNWLLHSGRWVTGHDGWTSCSTSASTRCQYDTALSAHWAQLVCTIWATVWQNPCECSETWASDWYHDPSELEWYWWMNTGWPLHIPSLLKNYGMCVAFTEQHLGPLVLVELYSSAWALYSPVVWAKSVQHLSYILTGILFWRGHWTVWD